MFRKKLINSLYVTSKLGNSNFLYWSTQRLQVVVVVFSNSLKLFYISSRTHLGKTRLSTTSSLTWNLFQLNSITWKFFCYGNHRTDNLCSFTFQFLHILENPTTRCSLPVNSGTRNSFTGQLNNSKLLLFSQIVDCFILRRVLVFEKLDNWKFPQ